MSNKQFSIYKDIRQKNRNEMPRAEYILWNQLRGKKLNGYKFRRQYSVGQYVVDFYCPRVKLAIEIDGDSHFNVKAAQKDEIRSAFIDTKGIRLLRFTNLEIYNDLDSVIDRINKYLV